MCEQGSMSQRSGSELPLSPLTLIFKKLPLRNRAGTEECVARVCSSWAEAAAAATVTIKLDERTNIDSLQQWLHSRGSGVREIEIIKSSGVISSLPCPKLEDSELQDSSVDMSQGSELLRDLCAATALTRLCFFEVKFQGEPDLTAVLSALPNLKWFGLCNLRQLRSIKVVQQSPQQQLLQSSTGSEEQDSHETSQQLWPAYGDPLDGYRCFTDSGMQFFCKLTKLQSLELGSLQGVTAAGLAGLADLPKLDVLTLQDLTCGITLSAVPAFSQLTALRWLTLRCVRYTRHKFDPAILAHMTQLVWLELWACTPACGTAGAAELPSRLSKLPQLEGLSLEWVAGLQEWPPEAFSCLTSSSVLKCLAFRAELPDWAPGPWRHMLPDKLRLPALTKLDFADAMTWSPSDLDRLVRTCCHLQKLSLCCSKGLQLTPLLQLTALTQLWLLNATEDSTVASLVQLSALQGLQELIIMYPCCFTDDDAVRSLTALTQLTRLGLSDNDDFFSTAMQQQLRQQFDQEEVEPGETCHIIIDTVQAPDGAPPDVWSQLLSCCEACALLPAASDFNMSDSE